MARCVPCSPAQDDQLDHAPLLNPKPLPVGSSILEPASARPVICVASGEVGRAATEQVIVAGLSPAFTCMGCCMGYQHNPCWSRTQGPSQQGWQETPCLVVHSQQGGAEQTHEVWVGVYPCMILGVHVMPGQGGSCRPLTRSLTAHSSLWTQCRLTIADKSQKDRSSTMPDLQSPTGWEATSRILSPMGEWSWGRLASHPSPINRTLELHFSPINRVLEVYFCPTLKLKYWKSQVIDQTCAWAVQVTEEATPTRQAKKYRCQ